VTLANGDVYGKQKIAPGQPWPFLGYFFGGSTPATHESFGALKSRNRGERGPRSRTVSRDTGNCSG
jgi:hypothetical protein